MYELIQVSGNSYYIQSPAKIGLYKLNDTEVCLIDSGNDKDAGRKIKKVLEANGWALKTIYNTHSNSDHIGGNKYLQGQTGCEIFAPGIECDFTNHTILEPSLIYGGYAPKDLKHKFILAQPSEAQLLTADKLPEGWEIIELPGHFFDMVGFRTPDDVVYLADCLSSRETIDKYKIGFIYDVAAYLDTLEKVKTLEAKIFVPSHAEPTEDIAELAQYNIDKVNEVADKIEDICTEPICFENILQKLFTDYGLVMNFEQHALVGSTVRSYLAYLKDAGRLDVEFTDNMLLWRKRCNI
ncbi:MAG: MBL fold metallo-hydrolase [Bacillota bacterium]|nr:MBL fold metallo-hydrolase [Bacillota bacterium]